VCDIELIKVMLQCDLLHGHWRNEECYIMVTVLAVQGDICSMILLCYPRCLILKHEVQDSSVARAL
jgi:hypothetical protein